MIYRSTKTFRDALKQHSKRVETRYGDVLSKYLIMLLTKVANRTPVSPYEDEDPGRAAGSWAIAKGSPGAFVVPKGASSSAREAIQRAKEFALSSPYAVWYVYNRVPYISALEYGLYPGEGPRTIGGYSTQAPAGMLRITVQELKNKLEGARR